jgi:hypothetical protein
LDKKKEGEGMSEDEDDGAEEDVDDEEGCFERKGDSKEVDMLLI